MAAKNAPRSTGLSSIVSLVAALCVGILLGSFLQKGYDSSAGGSTSANRGPKHGTILQLDDIPFRKTSHIDEEGRPIVKQQLLEAFAVPNFVGYSIATFKPGQVMMPPHEHKSMHEFFYVIEGTGVIQKDGVDHTVKPGTFLHMAPFEKHGIYIPKDATQDMKMVVCGVTVGDEK
jgi:quercetin dioxygenase-like cupin family protein